MRMFIRGIHSGQARFAGDFSRRTFESKLEFYADDSMTPLFQSSLIINSDVATWKIPPKVSSTQIVTRPPR
ncbi:MAG TPA: hypothetical protein VM553_07485, partial [Dongiaceae bacterium]|nr:hypothetical protein [Dongiaceae bacterium]